MLVPELGTKMLQILTEMLPTARRFAVLSDSDFNAAEHAYIRRELDDVLATLPAAAD